MSLVEMAERVHGFAARGVKNDCYALARAFLVERPDIAMGDIVAAVEGVDHHPDQAELEDRPLPISAIATLTSTPGQGLGDPSR
jgi:hypothetical protein